MPISMFQPKMDLEGNKQRKQSALKPAKSSLSLGNPTARACNLYLMP